MDISKIEKWSPSSNVYDDLRAVNLLPAPKIPARSTSTISYISAREVDNLQGKRSTVSMILPAPIAPSEQITTSLETILSMDDTKQSSSIQLIEQKRKNSGINKDCKFVYEEDVPSCFYWSVRLTIQLICIALFACFIGTFIFTLIFNAFDNYWLEHPMANYSFWWFDNNDMNFTEFDYDLTIQTIDYGDEY